VTHAPYRLRIGVFQLCVLLDLHEHTALFDIVRFRSGQTPCNSTSVPIPIRCPSLTTGPGSSYSASRPRVQLAVYWFLLAIGSHWPRLELFPEPQTQPLFQPDKGLHFVAFAVLTWLLIRAKIAGRSAGPVWTALVVGCIALSYAGLDELTQQWFQRQVALSDFVASAVGVLTVVLTITCHQRAATSPRWLWTRRAVVLILAAVVIALAIPPQVNGLVQKALSMTPWPTIKIDKPCHFIVGMVVTWLLAWAFPAGRHRPRIGVWVTILVMGLSAPMIETAQGYSGRGIEVADIYAHEIGMAVALALWAIVSMRRALKPVAGL